MSSRLNKDLMDILTQGDGTVSAFPIDEGMLHWSATIKGGKETVYDKQDYKLTIDFPQKYPYEPPTIKFSTPCYHPNVDTQGNICLDILKEKWSALYNVRTVLMSIQSLLADPNLESPLNVHAAELWKNKSEYSKAVLERYEKEKLKESNKK